MSGLAWRRTSSAMPRPASTPRSSGTGWLASVILMNSVAAPWPSLTTTRPSLMRGPSTCSTAWAMGAPALPAPTTTMRP